MGSSRKSQWNFKRRKSRSGKFLFSRRNIENIFVVFDGIVTFCMHSARSYGYSFIFFRLVRYSDEYDWIQVYEMLSILCFWNFPLLQFLQPVVYSSLEKKGHFNILFYSEYRRRLWKCFVNWMFRSHDWFNWRSRKVFKKDWSVLQAQKGKINGEW